MDLQLIARIALAIFCAVQGLATVLLDLNRTHATHPQWLGHARFHVVWQTVTIALLAILEIGLLFSPGPATSERFYLAAILASAPIMGFFLALITRHLYGGTLSDPGGIPPLRLKLLHRERRIDLNLVAELAGVLCIAALICLHHWATRKSH